MKLTHAFGVLLLVALVCAQTTPSDDGTSGSPDSDSCRAHGNGVMRNCEACAAFGEDESNTCNWCVSPNGAGACRSRAACQALSHEVGQCPSNTNPCESHTCDDNERCHVTASGAAACVHVCVGVSCNDDSGNTRVCLANNSTATGFECRPVCHPDYIDCGDDECRVEHAKAVCRDPCDNLCGSVTEAGIVASTCNRDTGVCQCSNDNTPVARTTTTTTADGESVTATVLVCSDVVMTEDPCDDVHCDDNSRCTLSADGNARCTCNPGYTRSTTNGRCVEIALDPCATALCAPNHRCVATPDGHAECICAPGYERRAGQCVEIVEPCGDDKVRNAFGVCVRECADGTAAIHGKCREDIVCHDGYIVSPHLDDGDYRCVFPCDALNTFVHHRCDCPIDCPAGEAYNRETCSCATNCADGTLVDADGLCDGCPLGTFPRVVTHTHVSSNEDGVNAATTITISRTECWVRCPEDDDDDAPVFKPSPDECPRPDCSIDQVRDRGTDECVGTCPDGTRPYNGNCDDLCELSSYECCLLRGGQNCVRPCDAGQIRVGDACVTPCDNATITSVNGECGGEGECPDDRFLIDTACKVRCPNGDVVDALSDCCPAHSRLDIASGVCFCWNGKRATREGCDRPCESPRECCRSPLVWDATNAACTCSDGSDPRDRGCPDINQCRDNLVYNADVDACLCPNGENPNDEGRCRCNVETNPDCPITPHNCEGRDDLRKCRCRNPDNADEPECQDPVVLSVRICKKYPNRRGCFCLLHPNSDRCKRPRPCAFTSAGCECASDANRDDLHCWCKLEANRDSRRCACFRDSSLCSFDDDDVPNCHDADITDSRCACFFDSTNPSFQLANGEIRCDINATTEERDHIETEVRCRNSAGDGVNAECEKDLDVGMPETDGNTTRVSVTMRERTDDERAMMEEEMGRPYVREDDIEVEVSDSDDEPATFRFRRTTVIRDYMGEDQDDGTTATDFDVRIGRIAEVRRETDDGVPTAEDEIVAEWFARDDERTVHTNVNDDGTCVTHTVTTSSGVVTYVSDICSVDREIGGRIIPAEAMRLSCQIDFPREYDDSYVCMAIHVRAHADDQEVRDVDGEEAAVEVINPDNDDERMVVGRADFSSDAFIGIGGESSVRCSAAVRSADGTSLVKKCCFDTPSSTFFWDPEMTPGSADPNVGAYENPDNGGTGAPINNNNDPDDEGGLSGGAIGGIAGGAGFCCIAGLVIGAVVMARGNKGDKPAATKANVEPARKAERSMSSIDSSSASSSADPTTDSQGASASSSSSA